MTDSTCTCRQPPFRHTDYDTVELGADRLGAEASLSTCSACGSVWLKYLIDEPQYSRSGRWWRVRIAPEDVRAVSAATAKDWIERASDGFAGGSLSDSRGHAVTAPIRVR